VPARWIGLGGGSKSWWVGFDWVKKGPMPISRYGLAFFIKDIYIAQVRKGHKCAISAEMAVWLRNCLCLYSYIHN